MRKIVLIATGMSISVWDDDSTECPEPSGPSSRIEMTRQREGHSKNRETLAYTCFHQCEVIEAEPS